MGKPLQMGDAHDVLLSRGGNLLTAKHRFGGALRI